MSIIINGPFNNYDRTKFFKAFGYEDKYEDGKIKGEEEKYATHLLGILVDTNGDSEISEKELKDLLKNDKKLKVLLSTNKGKNIVARVIYILVKGIKDKSKESEISDILFTKIIENRTLDIDLSLRLLAINYLKQSSPEIAKYLKEVEGKIPRYVGVSVEIQKYHDSVMEWLNPKPVPPPNPCLVLNGSSFLSRLDKNNDSKVCFNEIKNITEEELGELKYSTAKFVLENSPNLARRRIVKSTKDYPSLRRHADFGKIADLLVVTYCSQEIDKASDRPLYAFTKAFYRAWMNNQLCRLNFKGEKVDYCLRRFSTLDVCDAISWFREVTGGEKFFVPGDEDGNVLCPPNPMENKESGK